MTDAEEWPGDISAMMEKLWGPRDEHSGVESSAPPEALMGPGADADRPEPTVSESEPKEAPPTEALDALRVEFEATLAEQVTAMRAEFTATLAAAEAAREVSVDRVAAALARSEAVGRESAERFASLEAPLGDEFARLWRTLEGLRASAVTAERLDAVHDDAAAAAEARIAEAKARLLARLDGIAAGLGRALTAAITRLDVVDTQAAADIARLGTALEEAKAGAVTSSDLELGAEAASRLAAGLAGVRVDAVADALPLVGPPPVTADDLVIFRSEVDAGLAEFRASTVAELGGRLDAAAGQMGAVGAGARGAAASVAAALARVGAIDDEMAGLRAAVKAELAGLQPELEAVLAGAVEELRSEVDRRLVAIAAQAAAVQKRWRRRRGRKAQVAPEDLARLAELVEAWRTEGNEEVDALRAEIEALTRRSASTDTMDAAATRSDPAAPEPAPSPSEAVAPRS